MEEVSNRYNLIRQGIEAGYNGMGELILLIAQKQEQLSKNLELQKEKIENDFGKFLEDLERKYFQVETICYRVETRVSALESIDITGSLQSTSKDASKQVEEKLSSAFFNFEQHFKEMLERDMQDFQQKGKTVQNTERAGFKVPFVTHAYLETVESRLKHLIRRVNEKVDQTLDQLLSENIKLKRRSTMQGSSSQASVEMEATANSQQEVFSKEEALKRKELDDLLNARVGSSVILNTLEVKPSAQLFHVPVMLKKAESRTARLDTSDRPEPIPEMRALDDENGEAALTYRKVGGLTDADINRKFYEMGFRFAAFERELASRLISIESKVGMLFDQQAVSMKQTISEDEKLSTSDVSTHKPPITTLLKNKAKKTSKQAAPKLLTQQTAANLKTQPAEKSESRLLNSETSTELEAMPPSALPQQSQSSASTLPDQQLQKRILSNSSVFHHSDRYSSFEENDTYDSRDIDSSLVFQRKKSVSIMRSPSFQGHFSFFDPASREYKSKSEDFTTPSLSCHPEKLHFELEEAKVRLGNTESRLETLIEMLAGLGVDLPGLGDLAMDSGQNSPSELDSGTFGTAEESLTPIDEAAEAKNAGNVQIHRNLSQSSNQEAETPDNMAGAINYSLRPLNANTPHPAIADLKLLKTRSVITNTIVELARQRSQRSNFKKAGVVWETNGYKAIGQLKLRVDALEQAMENFNSDHLLFEGIANSFEQLDDRIKIQASEAIQEIKRTEEEKAENPLAKLTSHISKAKDFLGRFVKGLEVVIQDPHNVVPAEVKQILEEYPKLQVFITNLGTKARYTNDIIGEPQATAQMIKDGKNMGIQIVKVVAEFAAILYVCLHSSLYENIWRSLDSQPANQYKGKLVSFFQGADMQLLEQFPILERGPGAPADDKTFPIFVSEMFSVFEELLRVSSNTGLMRIFQELSFEDIQTKLRQQYEEDHSAEKQSLLENFENLKGRIRGVSSNMATFEETVKQMITGIKEGIENQDLLKEMESSINEVRAKFAILKAQVDTKNGGGMEATLDKMAERLHMAVQKAPTNYDRVAKVLEGKADRAYVAQLEAHVAELTGQVLAQPFLSVNKCLSCNQEIMNQCKPRGSITGVPNGPGVWYPPPEKYVPALNTNIPLSSMKPYQETQPRVTLGKIMPQVNRSPSDADASEQSKMVKVHALSMFGDEVRTEMEGGDKLVFSKYPRLIPVIESDQKPTYNVKGRKLAKDFHK